MRLWYIFLLTFQLPILLVAVEAFNRAPASFIRPNNAANNTCRPAVSLFATRRRSWDESYELLLSYKEKYGHTSVPQSEKPLGTWVNSQRIEHAKYLRRLELDDKSTAEVPKTSMNPRRKKLLDDAGFIWDAVGHTWQTRYEELCQFRHQHGHCVVPRSSGRLGAWVEKMRIEHKKYTFL